MLFTAIASFVKCDCRFLQKLTLHSYARAASHFRQNLKRSIDSLVCYSFLETLRWCFENVVCMFFKPFAFLRIMFQKLKINSVAHENQLCLCYAQSSKDYKIISALSPIETVVSPTKIKQSVVCCPFFQDLLENEAFFLNLRLCIQRKSAIAYCSV